MAGVRRSLRNSFAPSTSTRASLATSVVPLASEVLTELKSPVQDNEAASELSRARQGTAVKRKNLHKEQSEVASSATLEHDCVVAQQEKAVKRKKRRILEDPTPTDYPKRVECDWKIGAHISAAGGVENAILNAADIGANAFALFLKSQRKWTSPNLTPQSISSFKTRINAFGYSSSHILPHGSYLINLGNPDLEKREKSYACFVDDLKRCEALGLTLYNFHPGSTVGAATVDECLSHIASCINRAHEETSSVITVIENMAGSGNVIGSEFGEIAGIIERVKDKSRVGVCLDTCHLFAAGYDLRSKEAYEATIRDFDLTIGLKYLRGMHLNDSKVELGSKRDRHENIGQGHLTLSTFSHIVTDPRLKNIPLILETPTFESPDVWRKEIDVLNRISLAGSRRANGDSDMAEEDSTKAAAEDADAQAAGMVSEIKEAVLEAAATRKKTAGPKSNKVKKRTKRKDEDESDLTPIDSD